MTALCLRELFLRSASKAQREAGKRSASRGHAHLHEGRCAAGHGFADGRFKRRLALDKPVPHASVTYQSSAGIAPHAVRADSQGHFTITRLRSDNYDLRASGKGVFSEWEKNVTVRSGQTKSVTLRLIYAKEIPKAYTKSKAKE